MITVEDIQRWIARLDRLTPQRTGTVTYRTLRAKLITMRNELICAEMEDLSDAPEPIEGMFL